jgi:CheY-like chemotaxis protein
MPRVHLVHWKAAEVPERTRRLERLGHEVGTEPPGSPGALRALGTNPPDAIVIDLSRQPSHGREVALALRMTRATRGIPLVFVAGEPEKVARIRALLPDASYTSWSRIRSTLERAISKPPAEPVVPSSVFAGYAGTPLPRKLGIKSDSVVALVGAPQDFERTLGDLPDGITLRRRTQGRIDLLLWFVTRRRDLDARIARMAEIVRTRGTGLWIAWPKRASGTRSDLTQAIVRRTGLDTGLVDFKVCAIDATWSGLRFTARKG